VTDTGEKRELFGFAARHLKTVVVKEAGADACNKRTEKVETDGWYIELPATITPVAATSPKVQVDVKQPDCRDEVRYVRRYLEVKTVAQLTSETRPGEIGPKKPGVVRVGVAPVVNATDQRLDTETLSQALAESLSETDLDVVPLNGKAPADVDADAKSKDVDLVLQNRVSELKRPGRGLMGRLAGANSDELAAKVDFTLVAPGSRGRAVFSASERSGTSTLAIGIGAAKRVVQFMPPLMMARYGFLNTFTAMNAGASPTAMEQTQDPVISGVFSLIDRVTAPKPHEAFASEEAAVAAALEKEVQTLVSELHQKKN
jgi:hypothetical protein